MKSKKETTKSRTEQARDTTRADSTLPLREVVVERPEDSTVVELREETLGVAKEWTEAGAVLIKKKVATETQTVPVELGYEEIQVERVAINRPLDQGESIQPRQVGDTLIVPVVEEEVVVTKRLILREELRVTKRRVSRRQEVSGQVRKEQLVVETTGNLEAMQDRTSTQG